MAQYLVRLSARSLARTFSSASPLREAIWRRTAVFALATALLVALGSMLKDATPAVQLASTGLLGVALVIFAFVFGESLSVVDPLDPRAVALAGVPPARTPLVVAFAFIVSVPSLIALVVLVGFSLLIGASQPLGLLGAALEWLTVLAVARLGIALGRALVERRLQRDARSVLRYLGVLVAVPLVFALCVLPWRDTLGHWAEAVDEAMPLVPGASALVLGLDTPSTVALTVAIVTAVVAWIMAMVVDSVTAHRAMRRVDGGGSIRFGVIGRFASSPAWAVAWRIGISWLRDPRYQLNFVTVAVLPVLLLIPLAIGGVPQGWLVLIPLPAFAFLLGWVLHNDTAYDSTAFWLQVASGMPARSDRLGRSLPTLVVGTVLVIAGGGLTALLSGNALESVAVTGLSLALLGVATGGSALMSAVAPYPVAGPDDSPFAQPTRAWGAAVALHPLAGVIELAICAPVGVLTVAAIAKQSLADAWLAAGAGIALGFVGALVGIALGARMLAKRETDLLAFALSV